MSEMAWIAPTDATISLLHLPDCSKMYPNDPCVWRPPCRPRTGRIDERNRLFTTVDCGLSISTRWISSVIADFVFAFLSCVLVCESSA
jgi:hypothetical protein